MMHDFLKNMEKMKWIDHLDCDCNQNFLNSETPFSFQALSSRYYFLFHSNFFIYNTQIAGCKNCKRICDRVNEVLYGAGFKPTAFKNKTYPNPYICLLFQTLRDVCWFLKKNISYKFRIFLSVFCCSFNYKKKLLLIDKYLFLINICF